MPSSVPHVGRLQGKSAGPGRAGPDFVGQASEPVEPEHTCAVERDLG